MANEFARQLRKSMTDTEWRLWLALRNGSLDGHRFRRQHPIGPFVVDFVCLKRRLVIEVDGDIHSTDEQRAKDAERQRWLESEGYRVIRFRDIEIGDSLENALGKIRSALR